MQLTDYHAKYYACELTKRVSSDRLEKFAGALVDAQVDLNPHQVDAALFAFQSPLSKGALLADEVGLGKTIEAGLVISQKWAERKRRILIITPANLRKQWLQEIQEKFFLPASLLETRSYNEALKRGAGSPFAASNTILICSYQFARAKAKEVQSQRWDLVVLDEAHRLRNVYKTGNVIANTLKTALGGAPKLLLTATPLQNSLLELYGLVSFIDEHAFGDLRSFREQFANLGDQRTFTVLKTRLQPLCKRTLRRQVTAFVRYTRRHPLLQPFTPEASEERLYDLVSEYLRRENLQALPTGQRTLMTLVLRKLLASSTFAIAGALETISKRLQKQLGELDPDHPWQAGQSAAHEDHAEDLADHPLDNPLAEDFEALEMLQEEWPEEAATGEPAQLDILRQEIRDLERYRALAVAITQNAKGRALLVALDRAFMEAEKLGAPRKAIIFTESRRTQEYLLRVLSHSAFADGIVLFNGSNNDERSRRIYDEWAARHAGSDRMTGSRTADMRSALVDYFREQGQIMIATEAGAEGINLQFCSLVVNYDLPWNPQRIEQRIGRCHRYGQKYDVVVVNFLNQKNEADQRVFQLLAEKFSLFEGVFGASDEVLGAIESGVDFEKRIADIYQRCRTKQEIDESFDQLQQELSTEIDEAMTRTRRQLLENFDAEVQEKLRIRYADTQEYLDLYERMLMDLTRYELNGHADFHDGASSFVLHSSPFTGPDIPPGRYLLPRRSGEAHLYRLTHPLAECIVARAKSRDLPPAEIVFDYSGHEAKVAALSPYAGQAGTLLLNRLRVEALDQAEDYLLFAAVTDDGAPLEPEAARRLFTLGAAAVHPCEDDIADARLQEIVDGRQAEVQGVIARRNLAYLEAESAKLDDWADDRKAGLERDIKDLDRQIKEARRGATLALTLEDKLAGQKQVKALEAQRNSKRRALFEAQDEIDRQRGQLIEAIESKMQQAAQSELIFACRWRLA